MEDVAIMHRPDERPSENDIAGPISQSVAAAHSAASMRRGLLREEAADYCGMTPRRFSDHVKAKELPQPAFGNRRGAIWDRNEIDAALDRRMGKRLAHSSADAARDLIQRSQDFFKK